MTAFVALLAVAVLSWLFLITFPAVIGEDRLPQALRFRLDAVGPAAFAALLATSDLPSARHLRLGTPTHRSG